MWDTYYAEMDSSKAEEAYGIVGKYKAQGIVHTAAVTHVANDEATMELAFVLHVLALQTIIAK